MKHNFFRYWLRNCLPYCFSYILFFSLLLGLAYLFDVHSLLVTYAVLLMTLFASLALIWDLFFAYKQFKKCLDKQTIEPRTAIEALLLKELESVRQDLQEMGNANRQWQDEMDEYYTMWAHQMKIPLAASRLLLGEIPEIHSKIALEKELFKVEHYTDLVLHYLRLHSFHQDLLIEPIQLEEVMKQLVKKYSLFFIEGRIRLDLGNMDYQLHTDAKWFSLLIEQFLSNAVKYSEQSSVHIYLKDKVLVIADKGIGIAKSDLQRVFERGFSGYNGRRTQQSSGLGLYIAKRISQKLGYAIELESELGEGTTVRINLTEEPLLVK